MAPVEVQARASLIPAAIVCSHVLLAVYLYVVVLRTIFRSYLALGPSSATRGREPLRRSHIKTFSFLAVVSLMVGTFFALSFSSLSYRVWATERGVDLPESIFGDKGALRGGEHPGRLHLIRWLSDTPFYRDFFEIASEQVRHLWWSQQVNLAQVSWSMYLAIEGRRRKIGNLWAFLALSHLVNLSFTQNLFFVTVLLTPVPLPPNVNELTRESMPVVSTSYHKLIDNIVATKSEAFLPPPALYIVLLVTNYATIFLIPYAANTPSFMSVALLSKALPFSYLALPYIIPKSWATINNNPHAHHKTYNTLFQSISLFSALLHLKSTVDALSYSTAVAYNHRHTLLRPFTTDHLSARNRFSVPLNRLLTAITEHPAVSAPGCDVLLSGLSLGIWAAIRGLDGHSMLTSILPSAKIREIVEDVTEEVASIKEEAEEAVIKVERSEPPTTRRRGRPRKTETEHTPEPEEASVASSAPTPRRRGRPSKKKSEPEAVTETNSIDAQADDAAYRPTANEKLEEGDEDIPEDWESAALAWGLMVVGGLGVGSAGVYGAEITNR